MKVILEVNPVHLPWSLKTLNRACGAFRANTKKCSVSPRCGSLSASYRDKCYGWILIGAFITCAAMHAEARTEQARSSKRTPTESLRYSGTLVRHSLQTSSTTSAYCSPDCPAEVMPCSPPPAPAFLAFFVQVRCNALFSRFFPAVGYSQRRDWLLPLTPSLPPA